MARALVLGATGHIGAHVVRALLKEGHSVRAGYRSDRYLSVLDGLPLERCRVDLDTGGGLADALRGCEWVFHAAGSYPALLSLSPAGQRRDAVVEQAVRTLNQTLEAIYASGPKRVVFTSSAAVIRHVSGRLAAEADVEPWPLPDTRPLYATAKIAMEHAAFAFARRTGLPLLAVNPSVCIGEYDAHAFSGRSVLVFAKRQAPFVFDHTFNAVYTGDVGIGHVRAAERGQVGERYLLAAEDVELPSFARLVAEEAGVPPPRLRLPLPVVQTAALACEAWAACSRTEPLFSRRSIHPRSPGAGLDNRKAREALGMSWVPVREAVRRALAWFRLVRMLG